MGKKRDDVHKAEQTWGGQLDAFVSDEIYEQYKVTDNYSRAYFFVVASEKEPVIPATDPYIGVCEEVKGIYGDLNLALWQDPFGTTHPTNEFMTYLNQEGFTFFAALKSGGYAFVNEAKEQALVIKLMYFNNKPSLALSIFRFRKKKNAGATSLATLLDYRSSLKAQQEERNELHRLESIVAKHRTRR